MVARRRRAGKPLIGISGGDSRLPWGWWFAAFGVRATGGVPLRITPSRPLGTRLLDGVIIGGGSDIDPALYTGDDTGAPPVDPARDRMEMALIDMALQQDLPLLGICRGAQLLNVVLGGSLYADLRLRRRLTSNRRTVLPRKTALLAPRSKLARICGARRLRINSLHQQAVHRLGRDMTTAARDLDGIRQGVERRGRGFVIGVQWHPEYLPQKRAQRRLIAALVGSARRAQRRTQRVAEMT